MFDSLIPAAEATDPIPLAILSEAQASAWLEAAPPPVNGLATLAGFAGKAGQLFKLPDAGGALERVLFVIGAGEDTPGWRAQAARALPAQLPARDYRLDAWPPGLDPDELAIAFAQGAYRFDRYKAPREAARARLIVPEGAGLDRARAIAHACALARDMINTPANDLGPLQIETIAREIAEQFGADVSVVAGDALLAANYPAVHAVGRAAAPYRAPRMIELTWGDPADPVVAVIGKGVVFDTGGLDIKPSAGMGLMKKDMGGAAHALALGRMVMAAGLKVRLVLLMPVAENAISGDAMRPGDVIASRKGLTIEVGNTDAEGRLILADALARAAEFDPVLTVDLATLTGAARAALGPQLPPFYTADHGLAGELEAAARVVGDGLWRMPLWAGYAAAIDSEIADIKNDPDGWAQAGSVTAALFLQRFAPPGPWLHLDIYAWNPKPRPGWPAGGEAQTIRALFHLLQARYA
ncbi:MAG TPA: M17 family metallopeptidase [Caulobacteraceae bacterium]|nr:M17 family metallopeptidase [Caulobacteraceae bacterium]